MYKMNLAVVSTHSPICSRLLRCDTRKEAKVLALESIKYLVGSQKVSIGSLENQRHKVFDGHRFIGELTLTRL